MDPSLPDPQSSAAVLIGTSTYSDARLGSLPGASNNVTDLSAILTDPSLWGLPADRISVMVNRNDAQEVIEALSSLAGQARDTFIVYFAGHGVLTREGDLVLATRNTNADLPKFTGLPYAWVREIVGRCRAARRVVILDCCFSGRAVDAMSDPATAVIGQLDAAGFFVMASAPATSPSLAPQDARHTAFTGGLLKVLRDGVHGAGELLSLDEIYDCTLRAMARWGWPRPQRLGTNTIGRLGILRNRAWRRAAAPKPPEHRGDPVRLRQTAQGIHDAVAVVASTFGLVSRDGLEALDRAFPASAAANPSAAESSSGREAGIALVRETMLAMREQYGDGATTAAIILGGLVDGVHELLQAGAQAEELDATVSSKTAQLARQIRATDRAEMIRAGSLMLDELSAAIRTALGRHETAEAVVAAVASVGAGNVELVAGSAAAPPNNAYVIESKILAPNMTVSALTLEDPLVVVSTDGELDSQALLHVTGHAKSPLLIIAPQVSISTVRGLLHSFSQVAVVRPTSPEFDFARLRDQLSTAGHAMGWCHARRALVLPTTTTIDRTSADFKLSRNRITLTIPDSDGTVARRAIAIARSAADLGVVTGGCASLWQAAQVLSGVAADDPVSAVVLAAAAEPRRRLHLNTGADNERGSDLPHADFENPAVDSVATVRGALSHAAASVGRYLSGI